MKHVNINIYKLSIFYVVIILTLFDMLNGYMVIGKMIPENGLASPSQIGRLLAMFGLAIFVFHKRLSAIWVFGFVFFFHIELYGSFIHLNQYGFLFGLVNLSKFIYLFLIFLILNDYFSKDATSAVYFLGKVIKWNLIIISVSLVFSTITGIGNSTYGFGFGTKSFFASGNGLGVYIGVMTLISIYFKKSKLYEDISLNTLLIISVSIFLIGSKTAFLFSMICVTSIVWFSRFRTIGIIAVALVITFGGYYLIEVFNVIFDVVTKRYHNSSSLIQFLGSGRHEYVRGAFSELFSQSDVIPRLVFGGGAFLSFQSPNLMIGYDTLETDIFDVLFMYGFIGLIFLLSIYMYILCRLRKEKLLLISALLCILHSVFAGHVIFNGMSSLCIVVLFVLAKFNSIFRVKL